VIYIPHEFLIVVFAFCFLWKYWQYRYSRDPALLAVVGAFLFLATGYAMGEYAEMDAGPRLVSAMTWEFAGTVLLMGAKCCIAAFFVLASRRVEKIRRIFYWACVPLVAAVSVLAFSTVLAGPQAVPYGFGDPAVVAFYVGEKIFTVPIGAMIVYYCIAYRRLLSGTPAFGISLAVVGAALMLAATTTFAVQLGYYAASGRPPRLLVITGRWEIYVGQLVFVLGVSWYGLIMRLRTGLTFFGALMDLYLLRSLWRLSSKVLAEFLPGRRMPVFRMRQPVTSVIERRQFAMVDIRDALMLLSPQCDPALTSTVGSYAGEIRRVAANNVSRPVLYGEPTRAGIDRAETFDADRKLLVALATALGEDTFRRPIPAVASAEWAGR